MIRGIAIEAVSIERFERAARRRGEALLKRLFTDRERGYCLAKRFPWPHLAARFAAKVAFFRAAGRPARFMEVEVDSRDGRPVIRVLAEEGRDIRCTVSISHSQGLAVAGIVVEESDEGR